MGSLLSTPPSTRNPTQPRAWGAGEALEEAGGCQTIHPDHLPLQNPLLASSFESPKDCCPAGATAQRTGKKWGSGACRLSWGTVDTQGLTELGP